MKKLKEGEIKVFYRGLLDKRIQDAITSGLKELRYEWQEIQYIPHDMLVILSYSKNPKEERE